MTELEFRCFYTAGTNTQTPPPPSPSPKRAQHRYRRSPCTPQDGLEEQTPPYRAVGPRLRLRGWLLLLLAQHGVEGAAGLGAAQQALPVQQHVLDLRQHRALQGAEALQAPSSVTVSHNTHSLSSRHRCSSSLPKQLQEEEGGVSGRIFYLFLPSRPEAS